jgi:hypothetical protein
VSDALPADYGVNACGPRARAGMTREQREVHARLASLPKRVHSKTERDEMARQLRAADLIESLSRAAKKGNAEKSRPRPQVAPTVTGVSHRQMVYYALRKGPRSVAELRAEVGSARVCARISELREAGHVITTMRVGKSVIYTLQGCESPREGGSHPQT